MQKLLHHLGAEDMEAAAASGIFSSPVITATASSASTAVAATVENFSLYYSGSMWLPMKHWYLISTVIKMKLSSLVTYIFEIYSLRPFQRGITWAKKFANSWDSDSQLLEVIIKMSPDGANFLAKMFIEVREVSMQKITFSALLSATLEHF